ncbi:uncharacterized protein G2W53_040664 [Senna tora]|uniref:Uncharacterized protein n=1 Tax=Senna tora TaxID=362788 RepID=A0A834SFZ7_9FABA|nr:uncharacterized protein G2W53_040664 [Senna tora]
MEIHIKPQIIYRESKAINTELKANNSAYGSDTHRHHKQKRMKKEK